MLRNPNSNPLNGKKVNNPPSPSTPSTPRAHDGQAGAKTAMITPDVPKETPEDICLKRRKTLNEITIPASIEMAVKKIKDPVEKLTNIPPTRASKSFMEKSANNIL